MRRSKPHYRLECWRLSFEFVAVAYELARFFPAEERFGLTSQLQRAATSVPLNIAEGAGRDSAPDFRRFLIIARGSLTELDTILLLAERLGYLSEAQVDNAVSQLEHISALLNGLLKSIKV